MEIGPFVKCPHPEMIEAIALAGLDFAVVDMEHTPLGPRDLYPLVLAAECGRLPLAVRIPRLEEEYIKWCLDLGIERIQIPHITSAADVDRAVSWSYFHPLGERGLCRFVRAADFSGTPRDAYMGRANTRTELILQIEGEEALQNVPAILARAPRNACLFVGPYDLSQSLGRPGQIWDKRVVAAMEHIQKQCKATRVRFGTFTDTIEGIAFWKQRRVDLLEYASDLNVFIEAARALKREAHA